MQTKVQEFVPSATSTLKNLVLQKQYLVMQQPIKILNIKTPINNANSNRARLPHVVRALFKPPIKSKKIKLYD